MRFVAFLGVLSLFGDIVLVRAGIMMLCTCALPAMAIGQSLQMRPLIDTHPRVESREVESIHPAPTSPPLSIVDLEALAFANNPTLAAALARMDSARGQQVQAGLYPNPVVGYHGVELGLRGTAGQQGAIVSQRFITAGKRRLDQAIAGMTVESAHVQLHAQEQRVLTDVRIRFYEAHIAQQRVTLSQELAQIGTELVRATRQLIDARQGTENDLLQAEIRADEARILLDNARNLHLESWRRLATVIGVPHLPFSHLVGSLSDGAVEYDWHTCVATILGSNPELLAARIRVDRAELMIQRARREPIPNVDVAVSHRYHNVTQDNVTNIQLGLPIPAFDRNQGNIRSAEADWVLACREVERLELQLQDQLAVAYRRYANARHQVARYRERMVPRAAQSLQIVTNGYERGQVEYLTLLTAQQTNVQVNLSYLDALREYRTAASLIEGQLLVDSLNNHP